MFLACFFCALQTKCTPMYRNDSIGRNSSLERNNRPNLWFLENQISLVALLQVSRLNLTINEHLGVLPTGTFYWVNCFLRCVKVLGFTLKHQAAKLLPTWQLMVVLPKHKLSNVLTALTHSCCFSLLRHLQPKEVSSIKHVWSLNLNRRSNSGIEPARPVTISVVSM